MSGFSSWHAMSVVKQGGQVLQFGQRLRSGMFLYNSGVLDEGFPTQMTSGGSVRLAPRAPRRCRNRNVWAQHRQRLRTLMARI